MPNRNEIEINEQEDQAISDMIGKPPGFLLHSGITMVAIIVIALLLLAYFIKYPDKITAAGIITTEVPPLSTLAQSDGELMQMFYENNDSIQAGQYIAYLKNTTDLESIKKLNWAIKKIEESKKSHNYLSFNLPEIDELGMLQESYAAIKQNHEILQLTLRQSGVDHQLNTINKRIEKTKKLNLSLAREKELFFTELQLKEKDVTRQKSLKEDGVISEMDFEKSETEYLQYQRQYEGMQSGIIQNEIVIEGLEQESLQLIEGRNDDLSSQKISLNKNLSDLLGLKQLWEETYYVASEQSGVLVYNNDIHLDMFVTSGTVIANVVPSSNSKKIIKTMIPVRASGKIKKGQEINLKLPAYPYKEFGILKSKVHEIKSLPTTREDGVFYELIGHLSDSLITNYDKEIQYQPNMPADSEIITEDRSILERIFGQIVDLVKNN